MIFQARKINEIRNVIFGLRYGKLPQRSGRSWDVHQVEYLMISKDFWENFASITFEEEKTSIRLEFD